MSELQRVFQGVFIPAEIWDATDLTPLQKMLWGEIACLDHKERGCTASNKHLGERLQCHQRTVSEFVSDMVKKGYLIVSYTNDKTKEGRAIRKAKAYFTPSEKAKGATEKAKPPSEIPKQEIHLDIHLERKYPATRVVAALASFSDTLSASEQWDRWRLYKSKQHHFRFKTEDSELTALRKLYRITGGEAKRVAEVIEQSIGNGWSGLFELRQSSTDRPGPNGYTNSTGQPLSEGDLRAQIAKQKRLNQQQNGN